VFSHVLRYIPWYECDCQRAFTKHKRFVILSNEYLGFVYFFLTEFDCTQGHSMGYFGTGFGFSFAFVIAGTFFGPISAEMNPSMFLYLAIRGKLEYGWVEFVVGSIADLLGAFIGSSLTYFFWASHFWTVPLPQDPDPVSRLIHGPPDALSNDAGRLASAFGTDSRPVEGKTFLHELSSFGSKLVQGTRTDFHQTNNHTDNQAQFDIEPIDEEKELEVTNGNENHEVIPNKDHLINGNAPNETRLRSGSMSSESRLRSGSLSSERRLRSTSVDIILEQLEAERQHRATLSTDGNFYSQMHLMDSPLNSTPVPTYDSTSSSESSHEVRDHPMTESTPIINAKTSNISKLRLKLPRISLPKYFRPERKKSEVIRDAAFEAAIRADQSAKLSIFATRPAHYNRVANFLQEMTATFFLIFGIHMLNLRLEYNQDESIMTGPFIKSVLVAFYVVALVLGLGGTTGFAVNPARDLGPRLAHALLPIPGKGTSEWQYAWVPVFAPFMGAIIAAGVMSWMEVLYQSRDGS
jgi:glycerol uptake facilitator-like aquaporin